jgi:hypothetical protein
MKAKVIEIKIKEKKIVVMRGVLIKIINQIEKERKTIIVLIIRNIEVVAEKRQAGVNLKKDDKPYFLTEIS